MSKLTNKQIAIYRAYGIEVDAARGRLITPSGLTMTPPLQKGNTKTGRRVYTWSTLAGNIEHETSAGPVRGTCACNCPGCYAQAGRYMCANVRDALGIRTIISRTYPNWLFSAICAQLEDLGPVDVRISAAGDVEDVMIDIWRAVVRRFPECRFWTYTKNPKFEHAFDDIDGGNIVKSIIPEFGYNFGPVAYILAAYVHAVRELGETPFICRCGIDPAQHCEGCRGCIEHKYVLFLEHGTAYDAKKDPLFPVFVDIVESQRTASPEEIADRCAAILETAAA